MAALFGSGGWRLEVGFVRVKNSHRRSIPENVLFSGINEKSVASDRKEIGVNAEINGVVVPAFVIVFWHVFLAVAKFVFVSWSRLVHRGVVKVAVRLFAFTFEGLARYSSNSAKTGLFRISRKFSWELMSSPIEICVLVTGSRKKNSTKSLDKFAKKR